MKKLLTTLGLTSLASVTIANIATSTITSGQKLNDSTTIATVQNKQQVLPVEWHFPNQSVHTDIWFGQYIYVAIDNINLTSMGIKTINQLHQYHTIEVPDLLVQYRWNGLLEIHGDSWLPQKRNLGSEDWYCQFSEWMEWRVVNLYTAATLWIDQSGNLMMRLAYKAESGSYWEQGPGRVAVDTGTVVKFY